MIKALALPRGGTIAVVAPSGHVDAILLERGISYLESLGYKIMLGNHVDKVHRYFAGPDAGRAADIERMFQNKAVHAIFCARGGVGAARTIPLLNQDVLRNCPKIFVGLSDITSLHLFLNRAFSWVTFHGPMVATQFGGQPSAEMETCLFSLLEGQKPKLIFEGVSVIREGRAEAELTGGCMTLVCTTIGTTYEIETDDKILFLEDINEAPFRIDRMLSYLKDLGKFKKIKGLVFGQMPQCWPELLREPILEIFGDSNFPILFGFPSGHGDSTATLPMGLKMRLDTQDRSLTLLESAVSRK